MTSRTRKYIPILPWPNIRIYFFQRIPALDFPTSGTLAGGSRYSSGGAPSRTGVRSSGSTEQSSITDQQTIRARPTSQLLYLPSIQTTSELQQQTSRYAASDHSESLCCYSTVRNTNVSIDIYWHDSLLCTDDWTTTVTCDCV